MDDFALNVLDDSRLRATSSDDTPRWWRSLDGARNPTPLAELRREFPFEPMEPAAGLSRRAMMQIMGASIALAAAQGCRRDAPEYLLPRAHADPRTTPGVPLFFATAVTRNGWGLGVLGESYSGRPTKLEGNPDHPSSLGATDVFGQAEILNFYDPDRSQTVVGNGDISTWEAFERAIAPALGRAAGRSGEGLRLLTGNVTSPSLLHQIEELLRAMPEARWHVHEPVGDENARRGAELAFSRTVDLVYRFDQADVVVALDSDFMFESNGSVRYARDFAARRRVRQGKEPASMNRLYVVEPTPTITGAKADHRLPLAGGKIGAFARAVAAELGLLEAEREAVTTKHAEWARAIAEDLNGSKGRAIVIGGQSQPAFVHALTHLINNHLGNLGKTIIPIEPIGQAAGAMAGTLSQLSEDIVQHRVDCLVMIDTNPVYTVPIDLRFAERMRDVPATIHMGPFRDETSRLADWHLPMNHALESWGDVRAFDATACLIQPLIDPLYETRSPLQLLPILRQMPRRSDRDLVRDFWRGNASNGSGNFEAWWRESLRKGVIEGTQAAPVPVKVDRERILEHIRHAEQVGPLAAGTYELAFKPDPTIWDGRYANNAWLQEIPKPISKITWDNAAFISPALAGRLGLRNGEVVNIGFRDSELSAPVWIMPGQAEECITLPLGYGRFAAGSVGDNRGFNAYRLRYADAQWFAQGASVARTGKTYRLATAQNHHEMQGRHPVRTATIEDFHKRPESIIEYEVHVPAESLYPDYEYTGSQWGMAIDLTSCIGCNACTIACQAENNIPVVGKEQVHIGREMHWIRVDSYFDGDPENPTIYHQPVPCMHCEKAPCELVCPTAATTHSHDGLNEMTYNRCIGTRYCSNNCPYKVRRFNYLPYQIDIPPVRRMYQNPEVTVRGRGVMEKCTYCVQRIRTAEIAAKREDRPLRKGEVVTACQQVCPTQAIVFGDINNPESEVRKLKSEPHNYGLLAELGTRPRTSYLAEITNRRVELLQP